MEKTTSRADTRDSYASIPGVKDLVSRRGQRDEEESEDQEGPKFVFYPFVLSKSYFGLVGFFCLFAAAAFLIQPIAVGGFILWGGLAVLSAYGGLKLRSAPATKVSFFEDRFELSGSRSAVYAYPEIDTVFVSDLSKIGKFTFKDGSPSIFVGPRPKGGSATDFYEWLEDRLAGSGARIGLPPNGVEYGLSAPLAVLFGAPIGIFFVVFVAGLVLLGAASSSLVEVLAACPSLAAFLVLARRIAVRNDDRNRGFHGESASARTSSSSEGAVSSFVKRGTKWIPIVLALEVAGTVIVSLLPFLPGESTYFLQTFQSARQALGSTMPSQFTGIFSNNLHVLLASLVPIYGPLSLTASTYNTGRVIEAITQNASMPLTTYYPQLFALPHTWLELSAYAIAVFESFNLPYSWGQSWQMSSPRRQTSIVNEFALALVMSIGILALAGVFEVTEPRMPDPYLLWIPTVLVVGGLTYGLFRIKIRNPSEGQETLFLG